MAMYYAMLKIKQKKYVSWPCNKLVMQLNLWKINLRIKFNSKKIDIINGYLL